MKDDDPIRSYRNYIKQTRITMKRRHKIYNKTQPNPSHTAASMPHHHSYYPSQIVVNASSYSSLLDLVVQQKKGLPAL